MEGKPLTENCKRVYDSKEHVCFGISPFNSYFSERRLRDLAHWGRSHFQSMHFFVPDVPAAYTLEALGYTPERAAWKARRQANWLRNKIIRSLISLSFTHHESEKMVLDWEKLVSISRFQEIYREIQGLFRKDSAFRGACIEASHWILEKRVADTLALTDEALLRAVEYFLAEIPLFLDAASILNQKASVFAYHQSIPFLENLYRNQFFCQVPSERQGYVILAAKKENEIRDANSLHLQPPISESGNYEVSLPSED
ncbi:MAG: tRNA-dependent cyclodipeptide synthase [Bacteriovoracia bacterium]